MTAVTGTATTSATTDEFENGKRDGDVLRCSVDLHETFLLTVTYTLDLQGDAVTGTAGAGPFPASEATGNHRVHRRYAVRAGTTKVSSPHGTRPPLIRHI